MHGTAIDWGSEASLHRKGSDQTILYEFTSVRHGTLAEMVRFVRLLPEAQRRNYVILKYGDHMLDTAEIMGLAARSDCPA